MFKEPLTGSNPESDELSPHSISISPCCTQNISVDHFRKDSSNIKFLTYYLQAV